METSRDCTRICIFFLCLTVATISFTQCDATRSMRLLKGPSPTQHTSLFLRTAKKLKLVKRIEYMPLDLDSSKQSQQPYVSSPFTLPPYDSLAPINAPPFCTYPPNTPQTPSTTIPTPAALSSPPGPPAPYLYIPPILPMQSPPPGPTSPTGIVPGPPESISTPNPPETVLSPPEAIPSPTIYVPSPPDYEPSPPEFVPSPPFSVPSPIGFVPSPPFSVPSPTGFQPSPVFLPPIVFPPPTTPPSPKTGPPLALWCVAKPSVPDPIIQEAMNYACGSGADCGSIQPNGSCFEPNSLFAHASYAFNSYWQRTKVAGGSCDFGGTAMLVSVDPSYDGCQFVYY